MGLYLVDTFGNEVLLHRELPGCYSPMPVGPSPRPAVIPRHRDFEDAEGLVYVQNVRVGTHLEGVRPGSVRRIRVVESPEKRGWSPAKWYGQGFMAPGMNWHDFTAKRVLGTVPVEEDGSAYFTVPADRFIYFQLLDGSGRMVQSMRSGLVVQSGERVGCVGCHEDRLEAPPPPACVPLALRRAPSPITPWHGPPRIFSYLEEVQPVFDRPELSPCLARLGGPDQPAHREALSIIREGQRALAARPRADMPGFRPCGRDEARERKYVRRRASERAARVAIREGRKVYDGAAPGG